MPFTKEISMKNVFILMPLADEHMVDVLKYQIDRFLDAYLKAQSSVLNKERVMAIMIHAIKYNSIKTILLRGKGSDFILPWNWIDLSDYFVKHHYWNDLDLKVRRISNDALNCSAAPAISSHGWLENYKSNGKSFYCMFHDYIMQ